MSFVVTRGMSRITVETHVTLDGVIESPPEALLPYMSDEGRQATLSRSPVTRSCSDG